MLLFDELIINSLSFLMLLVVVFSRLGPGNRVSNTQKIFSCMLYLIAGLLIFDTIKASYPIIPKSYFWISQVANLIILLAGESLPLLWFLLVHHYIFKPRKINKKMILSMVIIDVVYITLTSVLYANGMLFKSNYQDGFIADNLYAGAHYFMFLQLLIPTIYVLFKNHRLPRAEFFMTLWMPILYGLGMISDLSRNGSNLVIDLSAVVVLAVFVFSKSVQANTDYLTGALNRRGLDEVLLKLEKKVLKKNVFSAILIDLNDFKLINDHFGHRVGDQALVAFFKILRTCVGVDDIVARYGGDEFLVILNITNQAKLQALADQIKTQVQEHNKTNTIGYELSFGMGYMVYNPNHFQDVKAFLHKIDEEMYHNKHLVKALT